MRTYFYIIRHALKQKHKICVWSFYIPMYHCALYVHWPENGQCQGNNQMIGDYLLKLKREYDHSLLVNRDSACPTSKVQLPPRRSKYSILCFYIPLRCLELKSYGFEKKLVDSCQAPTRSCQHLNFCFPGKTEHFYWLRTKELCWEASAVSFNFFFIFLSSSLTFLSSSKNAQKFKCSWQLAGAWHLSGSLFFNPYDFIW